MRSSHDSNILNSPVPKLRVELFQQKHGSNFFFQHRSREEPVCNLQQKVEPILFPNLAPEAARRPPKIGCVPAMRLDFFLEKPLHARGMLGRAAIFQCAANLRRRFPPVWLCVKASIKDRIPTLK